MKKRRKVCTAIALILTLAFAAASLMLASGIRGTQGYATDETWYASSARNILREIFGAQPDYTSSGNYHYSVFFSSYSSLRSEGEKFESFIKAEFGARVAYRYEKADGVFVASPMRLDREKIAEAFPDVKLIQAGFNYPDVFNIENYLNLEHPPLVKYAIGLSMLLLGDQPLSWRLPSAIAGSLALLVAYLIVTKLTGNEIMGLLVYLFAFADPVFRGMSSVAMLDIFVAFFIALSIWFALEKKYSPSAFFIGVASSCKLTGVFPLAALLLIMTMRRSKVVRIMLCVFAVPLLVWLSFNLPLIAKWGFQGWLNELTGSLSWFLASRPPGPSVSTPWGWFVNENPFVLNNGPDVVASVNVAVYSMALVALILVPYLTRGANRNSVIPVAWFIFNFLGYVLVYVLGNRTLYSFYVVTFSPMAYILACSLVHLLSQGLEKRYGGLLFRHKRRMSSLKIFSPISTTAGGLSRS